jgi:ADP-ribosylglycohydrolase
MNAGIAPIDNTVLLRELLGRGRIALRALPAPPAEPIRRAQLRNRVEGMLLGLAIGDSLGNTSESMGPTARAAAFGEVRDYLPNRFADGRAVGLPSDDTQLAFWTLRRLNEDGGLVPDRLAREFCTHRIFGIGQTVRGFIRRYRDEGLPWEQAGVRSAGNGALMRIAPVLVPHLASPMPSPYADAAIAATITHDDTASVGSCVAFTSMLWALLERTSPPPAAWWIDTFTDTLRPIETDTVYHPRRPGLEWSGSLSAFIDTHVRDTLDQAIDCRTACDRWYSGAYLLETVPSVLHILAMHGDDAEEAIVRAVNDTRDNDTIAAIVGAAVGALHGRNGLPARWITGLAGRTGESDDGEVFRLVAEAERLWVHDDQ